MVLLTETIENDRYFSFANPIGELFQKCFIVVPITSGQATAYSVREPDRLQFRRRRDLIERVAEGFKS